MKVLTKFEYGSWTKKTKQHHLSEYTTDKIRYQNIQQFQAILKDGTNKVANEFAILKRSFR